jgi:hypothetical protein
MTYYNKEKLILFIVNLLSMDVIFIFIFNLLTKYFGIFDTNYVILLKICKSQN